HDGGTTLAAARELGLPWGTVNDWEAGRGAVAAVMEINDFTRPPLADRLEELAHQLIDCIPAKLDEAPLREVAAALNVAAEKMRLLREQATAIERHEPLSHEQ